MRLFKEVAIIGPGLIGGSIALAIKEKKISLRVTAVSRHKKTIDLARKLKAIDSGSRSLSIVKSADLLILAVPVETILRLADALKGLLPQDCIVVDVGSSKKKIVAKLQRLFPFYIGAHPLAGSQNQGIKNARADMFKGSLCVLTPTARTKPVVLDKVSRMWKMFGARVALLSPKEHDRILAMVSHLPHCVSFALMAALPKGHLKYASSGLRDTTRIAGSDAGLWVDIFLSNRENMLKAIAVFQKKLEAVKKAIRSKDRAVLIRRLTQSNRKRRLLAGDA
ncbi:MAG: prephenate dehydrogenase [Candidatus Omnitrophota bacterium]